MKNRWRIGIICILLFCFCACESKEEAGKQEEKKIEEVAEAKSTIVYSRADEDRSVLLQFSKKIQDPKGKIVVKPEVEVEVIPLGEDRLLLRGDFTKNAKYLADFSALTGEKKDVLELVFPDKAPKISFEDPGILVAGKEKSLSLACMNVKEVEIRVTKILENNLHSFVNSFQFTEGGDYYYSFENRLEEMGEVIWESKARLEPEKNVQEHLRLDLQGALKEQGIYAVEVRGKGLNGRAYGIEAKKVFISSNLGILVARLPKSLEVRIVDLETREPQRGAKVYLMTKNNQVLEEGVTGKDGLILFHADLKRAYYLKVEGEKDYNLLKLQSPLPLQSFAVDGLRETKTQIYLASDRPTYRPGESLHVNLILRQNGRALSEGQPVKVVYYDAKGNKEEEILPWKKSSFYTLTKKIPKRAQTGTWGVEVFLGEERQYLALPVEAKMAKKLVSHLEVKEKKGEAELSLVSKTLDGRPSPDQVLKGKASIDFDRKTFLNYENFSFELPEEGEGERLDFDMALQNGKAKCKIKLPLEKKSSWDYQVSWEAIPLDANGRANPVYAMTKVSGHESFLGLEEKQESLPAGEETKLSAVVLDPEGKRLAGHKLKYRVYQKSSLFWYDAPINGRWSLKEDKAFEQVAEGEVTTKKDEDAKILLPPLSEGLLYVEVEDQETKQMAGANYRLSYWSPSSRFQEVSKLRMNAEKKEYQIGETAKIYWEGSKGSMAYISLEKDGRVLGRYQEKMTDKEGSLEIPIREDLVPTAYLRVVLLQDFDQKKNDRPARLYGILPLSVKDEAHKANLRLEVAKEVESKGNLEVSIQNEKEEPMDYAVSVLDLGLLQERDYKVLDPHAYFFGKRAYLGRLYDNYSFLLRTEERKAAEVLSIGGGNYQAVSKMAMMEAARDASLGMERANRFQNLALYEGIVTSDAKGEAKLNFKLPRYHGRVKVIVTAANESSYGSATKEVLVRAPLRMESSLPRSLKIGDRFQVSCRLEPRDEKIQKGKLRMEFEGQVLEEEVILSPGKEKLVTGFFRVGEDVGVQEVKLSFASPSYQDEESISIDVNALTPYAYHSEEVVIPAGKSYVLEGEARDFALSLREGPDLDAALAEFLDYPYVCAEQITSKALVTLYLKDLERTAVLTEKEIQTSVNESIYRLRDYETRRGFHAWPGGSSSFDADLSIYVGEFLLRAKAEGYYVNAAFYEKVLALLQEEAKQNKNLKRKLRALWVLAGSDKASMAELNYLRESCYESLDLTEKWLLLSAYAKEGEGAYAKKKAKELLLWDEGIRTEDLALRVEACRSIYGSLDQKDEKKLMEVFTKLNPYDTLAMARCLLGFVSPKDERELDFAINGRAFKERGSFQGKLKEESLSIENKGKTPIYLSSFWKSLERKKKQEALEEGLQIERTEIPKKTKKGEEISWKLKLSLAKEAGLRGLREVALVEILPSGWEWEVEQRDLQGLGDFVDLRDDRLIIVFPYVGSEPLEVSLKARAITEGSYVFPGTLAEGIRNAKVRGQLAEEKVEIQP